MLESIKETFLGLPAEMLIGGVLLLVVFVYMFSQGRGRAIAAGLGLVVTAALYEAANTFTSLSVLTETAGDSLLVRIAFFVAILIIVVRFLNKGIHGEYTHYRGKMIAQVVAISATFWGLLLAYSSSLLHLGNTYPMSDLATKLFAGAESTALWLVALFISIVFLIKR